MILAFEYDDILRYVFSVEDRNGDEVYRYEVEESQYAPITELLIFIRDLLREEPDAFPVKVHRTDVLKDDIWGDGELVAMVASRRQALDLLHSARQPRAVHRQAFADILRRRNDPREATLSAARQAVADLSRQVDELAKAIPSGKSHAAARAVAERVADGGPRFLPLPEGFADLVGSGFEFESNLREAAELWFGPIHHEGVVWWCQGFKPIGLWKWSALVPGDKGIAVTRDRVQEMPLPNPVSLACFAFTGLRQRAVFSEQIMAAAKMSEKFFLAPALADVERQVWERTRLLNELAALRTRRDAAADKLRKLEGFDFWDGGLSTEPPYHAFLSGRKLDEVAWESNIDQGLVEPIDHGQTEGQAVVRETYVHHALERRELSLPISKEWVDCDETDLFFRWRKGLNLVSLRIDHDLGNEGLAAYSVHEVSILNGIRRGVEPLLRLVAPAERTVPAGVDFDRFCVLVVNYIAQRSRGYVRGRYVRRISEVRALHADLWNERKEQGPGWEAKNISARAAEGRPTPLELPPSLILPPRANIAFELFTKPTGSVICDPVFWDSAIWIVRATKPPGVHIKKTNLTVSPTAIRIDADGCKKAEPPEELASYLIQSGLLSRRALNPGQESAVVAWAMAEFSGIMERVARAAVIDTSEIDGKITAAANRISRLEAKARLLGPAHSMKEFFDAYLNNWRAYFPFDYHRLPT